MANQLEWSRKSNIPWKNTWLAYMCWMWQVGTCNTTCIGIYSTSIYTISQPPSWAAIASKCHTTMIVGSDWELSHLVRHWESPNIVIWSFKIGVEMQKGISDLESGDSYSLHTNTHTHTHNTSMRMHYTKHMFACGPHYSSSTWWQLESVLHDTCCHVTSLKDHSNQHDTPIFNALLN